MSDKPHLVVASPLPATAGDVLLSLARQSIAARLSGISAPTLAEEWLRAPGASFVTLTHAEKLRGCIGTLQAHRALGTDVMENAVAAAFSDPRFQPLTSNEFADTGVEVSVLSVLEELACRNEDEALQQLRPEIDGVVFEYGRHRSTFLPQVWKEFSDARLFLGQLRYKAGLPPTFWDPGVRISRYTVRKWRERAGSG